LKQDPNRTVAAANLGVIYARRGLLDRSIALWKNSWEQNPGRSEIGANLSIALCARGERQAALDTLTRVLIFDPDQHQARKRLSDLSKDPNSCPR
jgi:tetratricopeptide (TPR) repeat protein